VNEEMQPPRTLHDRLFKEFLHRFLPDFLWIFFPAEAERLNFATLQFLDKKLIINFAGQELRITDIVAEVATWEGVAETITVHLEVEGRDRVTFEFMNTYAPTSELSDLREAIMDKLLDVEMTWGDRLRAEGRTEGRVEGQRTLLLRLLTLMFGEAPASVVERIRAIRDEETLTQVAQQLVTIQSLDELVLPNIG
jgi:hypothetical protein